MTVLLPTHDINFNSFTIKSKFYKWLDLNSSTTIDFLVLETEQEVFGVISHVHRYNNIHSILIRSTTNNLTNLKIFARLYSRIDGIYDDDTRLLIKLLFGIAFVSEEMGDEEREINNREVEAQRNYSRVLKLCALVKTI